MTEDKRLEEKNKNMEDKMIKNLEKQLEEMRICHAEEANKVNVLEAENKELKNGNTLAGLADVTVGNKFRKLEEENKGLRFNELRLNADGFFEENDKLKAKLKEADEGLENIARRFKSSGSDYIDYNLSEDLYEILKSIRDKGDKE